MSNTEFVKVSDAGSKVGMIVGVILAVGTVFGLLVLTAVLNDKAASNGARAAKVSATCTLKVQLTSVSSVVLVVNHANEIATPFFRVGTKNSNEENGNALMVMEDARIPSINDRVLLCELPMSHPFPGVFGSAPVFLGHFVE